MQNQSQNIHDSLQQIFTKRLNELKGNMSDTEFAEMLGISRNTIGYFTRGERLPNAESLRVLAAALHTTTDYLLGLTDAPTTDADLRSVVDFMGYSQGTIENLWRIKTLDYYEEGHEVIYYDEDGMPIFNLVSKPMDTLLRAKDNAGTYSSPFLEDEYEEYTREEAKKALDKFFSAKDIYEFFAEIAHLQTVFEDTVPVFDEMKKSSIRTVKYSLYSFAEVAMRIAEQAFEKGEK